MHAWLDERHGPLPLFLLALTFVTGMVDAASFLALGHVFVANMTGNVAFLGFALGGVADFSIAASLVAIAAFLVGAIGGGRLGTRFGAHRGRLLAIGVAIETVLLGAAALGALAAGDPVSVPVRYGLFIVMALAMGVQVATARRLGVPDLPTVVITQTLTGLASESTLAGGTAPNQALRIAAPVAMLTGAGLGAALVLAAGLAVSLGVTWLVIAATGVFAWQVARSSEPWTIGR